MACKDAETCAQNERQARDARGALEQIGGHLGKPAGTPAGDLLVAVRERCAEFDRTKAERDALKTERDALKGQVDKRVQALARECAQLELELTPVEQNDGEDDVAFEKRGKDALKAATERYQALSLDHLEHQRSLLTRARDAALGEVARAPTARDGTRPAGGEERSGRGATTDRIWPKKEAA